jgi:hypothetical protein
LFVGLMRLAEIADSEECECSKVVFEEIGDDER